MKKILIAIVVLAALGFGWWTISPFFIDKKVSEEFPTNEGGANLSRVYAQGSFEGFDNIHYGSGDTTVLLGDGGAGGYIIRFEENFNVANGPDLYVGLGKDGKYIKGTELGKLKGNIGSQNYIVPENINIDDYNEVWVWCRAFSVGFAKARLNLLTD